MPKNAITNTRVHDRKNSTKKATEGKSKLNRTEKQTAGSNAARQFSLLLDLHDLLEDHLDDENYTIDHLCRDLAISRSNLHKRLKALTGLSTSIYVRGYKLIRAQEILEGTNLNITQVAYEIGFEDPTYFTRVFSKTCKISPKAFRKKLD
ncbi:MAG: AraC family transcriptional regulator [Bacteroidota bacterium]